MQQKNEEVGKKQGKNEEEAAQVKNWMNGKDARENQKCWKYQRETSLPMHRKK